MLRILSPLLAIALYSAAPAQPPPASALANPGFEEADPATGQASGWSRYVTFPGSARLSVHKGEAVAGASALRVETTAGTRCALSQYVTVSDAGPYTFSCRARGEGNGMLPVQVQIEWFRLTDWPRQVSLVSSEQPSPAVAAGAQWAKIAATSSHPQEAQLALVSIIIGGDKSPAGALLLDEADLRPGAFPEPLVSNPDFELDSNNDGQPDGWSPALHGEGFTLTRDTAVAHSGTASVRLTGAANHGDRSAYVTATPVFTPPQKLRLSYWYKGSGTSAVIMHLLTPAGVQKPGGGIEYGAIDEAPPLTPQWQQFSREIAVPPEAREAGIMRVDIILYQKGEGTLWYDDVKVELQP